MPSTNSAAHQRLVLYTRHGSSQLSLLQLLLEYFTAYAVKPDIGSESRFLRTPPAFDAPLGGFPSEYCYTVRYRKTRMAWLPDGEKILKIRFTIVMDTQTDTQTPHDGIGRTYA